ncbi:putative Zinc finger, RING-CH-type, Zinc finger, RING/FYVE/PHD-type [Helianthus anomalus]
MVPSLARAVDQNGPTDDEEQAPLLATVECRICQEEDSVDTLETPCACNDSLNVIYKSIVLCLCSMLTRSVWCNEKGDITCEICDQDHIGLRVKMAGGHCPSRWQEVTCAKGKFSGGFDISACIWCTAGRERAILQRPMAGSQVLYCLIEKKMSDSWSPLNPNKKKECASNQAAYYPIGVDVFLSPRKIDHIARLL